MWRNIFHSHQIITIMPSIFSQVICKRITNLTDMRKRKASGFCHFLCCCEDMTKRREAFFLAVESLYHRLQVTFKDEGWTSNLHSKSHSTCTRKGGLLARIGKQSPDHQNHESRHRDLLSPISLKVAPSKLTFR